MCYKKKPIIAQKCTILHNLDALDLRLDLRLDLHLARMGMNIYGQHKIFSRYEKIKRTE